MKRILRTLAPTIVIAILAVSVWAIGALQQGREKAHRHTVHRSDGFTRVIPLDDESNVVLHGNSRIAAYSRDGDQLWETDFASDKSLPNFTADDIAVDASGDVLAIGAIDEPMTTLFRLSRHDGTVDSVARFPDLAFGTMTVGPAGKVYLVGFSARRMNQLIANPKSVPPVFTEPIIHELDSEGSVARSFGEVRTRTNSIQQLADFQSDQMGRRLVFSPSGSAYLLDADRLELEIVDMAEGLITGLKYRLSTGRPSHHARIECLDFLDRDKIILSLFYLGPSQVLSRTQKPIFATLEGWEIRTVDLDSGTVETLAESDDPGDFSVALVPRGSNRVRIYRALGPDRHHSQERWKTGELLFRLGRRVVSK